MGRIENEINIKGNVEKLLTVAELHGNIVNTGTIYLVATFEAFNKISSTELSTEQFKKVSNEYIERLIKYHSFSDILSLKNKSFSNSGFYIYPRISDAEDKEFEIHVDTSNLLSILSHEETYIFGAAGSGKSTFLKFLIQNILELNVGAIPIFISLASFQARCRSNRDYTIYDQIIYELKDFGFQKSFVDFMLKNAPVILLLDGFDEGFRNSDEKKMLIEHINSYRKIHNEECSKVVITSRTKDYTFHNPNRRNFELLGFDKVQIDQFLLKRLVYEDKITSFKNKLYLYFNPTFENRNESDTPEKDWSEDRTLILSKSKLLPIEIQDVVMRQKIYPQILSSPLLLSLLIYQFEKTTDFSSTKLKLLDYIIDDLLKRNEAENSQEFLFNKLNLEEIKNMYYFIAFHLLKNNEIVIDQKHLFTLIEQFLIENNQDIRISPEQIFKSISNDLGLFREIGYKQYKFIHLNIQEYFAALYLKGNKFKQLFDNGLVFKKEWSQVVTFSIELFAVNEHFQNLYFNAITKLFHLSPPVNKLINWAIEKARFDSGEVCFGAIFYYICMSLYYNIGDRAIYSCQRLAHEILSRTHGVSKEDPIIPLNRLSSELSYIGKKIKHSNLQIDGFIFQLYEKHFHNAKSHLKAKDIIRELGELTKHDSDFVLIDYVEGVKVNDQERIEDALKTLFEMRDLQFEEKLSADNINILTNILDLIESFLMSSYSFGKSNLHYQDLFGEAINTSNRVTISELSDYLTSRDYFEIGAFNEKINPDLAFKSISKAIEKNPINSFYYYQRGSFCSISGNHDLALSDFLSAERLNPDYKSDVGFQLSFGRMYQASNDYINAIKKFDKLILEDPNSIPQRWFKVEILLKTSQYLDAVEQLKILEIIYPEQGHFYYTSAYCYLKSADYFNAYLEIQKAIDLEYYLMESLFIKSYSLIHLNRYKEVIDLLLKHLKDNPTHTILYIPLIKSYQLENNIKLFNQYIEIAIKSKLIKNKTFAPVPISPGNIEMKRFGKAYFLEDFSFKNYINFY